MNGWEHLSNLAVGWTPRQARGLKRGRYLVTLIIIIVVLLLLFGGGGGYYAHRSYGLPGLGGILGLVVVVLILLWLFGGLRHI